MAPTGRKASVGTILLPARLNLEATMAGLPLPLMIAIWLTGAMWVVGLAAYSFGCSSALVWFVLFLGTGAGLLEWRGLRNGDDNYMSARKSRRWRWPCSPPHCRLQTLASIYCG